MHRTYDGCTTDIKPWHRSKIDDTETDTRQDILKNTWTTTRGDTMFATTRGDTMVATTKMYNGYVMPTPKLYNPATNKVYKSYKHIETKESYGIACVRVNALTKFPEILMVCKRCTYMFQLFVTGKWNDENRCIYMFNLMTIDEKLDILSLNFNQMWYRLWLATSNTFDFRGNPCMDTPLEEFRNTSFYNAKRKFESTFLADKGERLRKLIGQTKSISRIWEIPKGKKDKYTEESISCAIREFEEETGIDKSQYNIHMDELHHYTFIDDGVRYKYHYYLATCSPTLNPIACKPMDMRIGEICKVKWMDINAIKHVDNSGNLTSFAQSLFRRAKQYR